MKICFFSQGGFINQSGATYSLMDVAEELINRGHEVLVVVAGDRNLEIRNGIRYLTIPFYSMRMPLSGKKPVQFIKYMIKSFINQCSGVRIFFRLKNERIDLVHINGISTDIGPIFAKRIHRPCVWHIRQLLEEDLRVRIFREKNMIRWMNQASATIAISRAVQEKFARKLVTPPVLIYNGVPVEKYAIKDHQIFERTTTYILLAGRITAGKGQMEAIRAVEELVHSKDRVSVYLTITGNGDGAYLIDMKDYVKEHGLEDWISILPHQTDMRSLRKEMDIGLVCSKCEAFGRVTVETMMSKSLLIGADTGATPELIEDGVTGFLYRQGDYHSLAEKIRYAVTHREESRQIAERGYSEAIEKYSITRNVDQITALYEEILRKHEN